MTWFSENIGTLIVSLVLLGIVGLIVRRMVVRRQAGQSMTCDDCSSCGAGDACPCSGNSATLAAIESGVYKKNSSCGSPNCGCH
jgi:hypothetical protein